MQKPGKQRTFRHLLTNSWELYPLELIFCGCEWLTSPCSEWWESVNTKHSTRAKINQSHWPPGRTLRVPGFFFLWSLCSDGSIYPKHTFQICTVSAASLYLGLFSDFPFLGSFMTTPSPRPPCTCAKSLQSCPNLFVTPWTVAHQAPLSVGFSRQEYWSELPCSPPGDLPNLGIEPRSPTWQADSLSSEPPGRMKEESEKASLKFNLKKPRSWHLITYIMANKRGKSGSSEKFYFLGLQNHCWWWLQTSN